MDLLAHTLWAGAGVAAARRRWSITPGLGAAAVALAALPDMMQGLPVAGWVLTGQAPPSLLWDFALADPAHEPPLAPWVALWRSAWLWALAGWWLHIVIDVFTHSADFYPVPVLYPLTMQGFDGLAWNTPWFQWLNYGALAVALLWLWRQRHRPSR